MGAQLIISQTQADEGFGLLKDIVAIVKDPDAIDKAYQRRLDAAKLTDDEVAKADAARALIAKADALKADLAQQVALIESEKAALAQDASNFIAQRQSEIDKRTKWEAELNAAALTHTEAEKKNQLDAKALDDRAAQIDADNAAKQKQLDQQAADQAVISVSQEAETCRLAAWRNQLRDKAAKLAALAQSDG